MIKRTKILLCHVIVSMLMLLEFSANANTDTNTQVQTPTEQKFNTHNNGIIKAFASKDEITRIAFEAQVTEVHAMYASSKAGIDFSNYTSVRLQGSRSAIFFAL